MHSFIDFYTPPSGCLHILLSKNFFLFFLLALTQPLHPQPSVYIYFYCFRVIGLNVFQIHSFVFLLFIDDTSSAKLCVNEEA